MDEFEPSPVKFKEMRDLPKTPLQRLLNRPHASEPAQNQEPQTQNHLESDSSEESSSSNQSINLLNVIQRQSDLADLLMLQHPLSFQIFICAFKYGIENKTDSDEGRLYYLEQYTSGQPREPVRSCFHMKPDKGYAETETFESSLWR